MKKSSADIMLYGLASCDACRGARHWLDAAGIAYGFHDLRADGLEVQTLERWASRIHWQKLVNRQSVTWRKLPEVDRSDLTWTRALVTMLEHPTLVKRPVLEHRRFIAVGFSPEQYREIFSRLADKS